MDVYRLRAEVVKALAHPTRLQIIDYLLDEGEKCVCDIAVYVKASQPMASKHVSQMRDAGLLVSRKEGPMVFYKVATPCIANFFACLDKTIVEAVKNRQAVMDERGAPGS